jgi:hypothetical protein
MRVLPRRHPARWLMERYQPYHRLLRMSRSREQLLVPGDETSPRVVVWNVGKGMQVGVLREIAELLRDHDRPSDEFGRLLTETLRSWALQYPAYRELGTINVAGVWGGDMESITTMRIGKMWERQQAAQRAAVERAWQINAYAHALATYLLGSGLRPRSRDYARLSSDDRERITGAVTRGVERYGIGVDLNRLGLHKLR